MTTLKYIADEAGVSIRTVRRVLNNDNHVRPEKVEKIKKIIERTGYTPNLFARGLQTRKSNITGIIVSNLNLEVTTGKLNAIQTGLMTAGYGTMLGITSGMADIEEQLVENYSMLCDGIIFLFTPLPQSIEHIKKSNIPYVISDSGIEDDYAIAIDRQSGIMQAIVEQQKNYRQLLFLSCDKLEDDTRKNAFKNGVRSVGRDDYTVIYSDSADFDGGRQAVGAILKKRNSLTICYNDRMAAGLLKGLYDIGGSVPDDYGIVGFDNDNFTKYTHKAISTITQSIDELAEKTIKLFMAQIAGESTGRILPVETKFISRDTTCTE